MASHEFVTLFGSMPFNNFWRSFVRFMERNLLVHLQIELCALLRGHSFAVTMSVHVPTVHSTIPFLATFGRNLTEMSNAFHVAVVDGHTKNKVTCVRCGHLDSHRTATMSIDGFSLLLFSLYF